jgi:hypothetical protein
MRPRSIKPKTLGRAVALAATAAAAGLLALAAVAAWDERRAIARLHDAESRRRPGASFARRGDVYETSDPLLPKQSFAAAKRPGELRVFVLGSSQAMGVPYVHQNVNFLTGRLIGLPNEGGLSTWLRRYLEIAGEGRPVTVVNAAKGSRDLAEAVATMAEIVEIGQPDALVILEGNNERAAPGVSPTTYRLEPGADLGNTVDFLTRRFREHLAAAARRAESGRVPTYVLTVPNNLRDWSPHRPPAASLAREDDPALWMRRARDLDARGRYAAARDAYVRAKDLDHDFLRTRSAWNEEIRRLPGPWVRVLDLERVFQSHARDGIPGADLFHDYCHMTLAANRLAAFELARRLGADLGLKQAPRLEDADLRTFGARRLRLLYAIKALQWARRGLQGFQPGNAEVAAETYFAAARSIDEQLRLYR